MVHAVIETVEQRIVEDILTTLQGISALGGEYTTSVGSVAEMVDDELALEPRPAIALLRQPARNSHGGTATQNTLTRVDLRLTLIVAMDAEPRADYPGALSESTRAMRRMLGDIKKALTADHTRGGLALDTLIEDDEIAGGASGPLVVGTVTVAVSFRHFHTDPTQPY